MPFVNNNSSYLLFPIFWVYNFYSEMTAEIQKYTNSSWKPQDDQCLLQIINNFTESKLKWSHVAQEISKKTKRERSGKQCRQRWLHHLNPQINKSRWEDDEIKMLFQLHRFYGNRWSTISQKMEGRTDNIIKNYFYSYVRRGLTKINSILNSLKKKKLCKSIRPFSSQFTSKLILVSDGNYQTKVRLNSLDSQSKAKEILYKIVDLTLLNEESQFSDDFLVALIETMHSFRLNSKKRKRGKKAKNDSDLSDDDESSNEDQNSVQGLKSSENIKKQDFLELQSNYIIKSKLQLIESSQGIKKQQRQYDFQQTLNSPIVIDDRQFLIEYQRQYFIKKEFAEVNENDDKSSIWCKEGFLSIDRLISQPCRVVFNNNFTEDWDFMDDQQLMPIEQECQVYPLPQKDYPNFSMNPLKGSNEEDWTTGDVSRILENSTLFS